MFTESFWCWHENLSDNVTLHFRDQRGTASIRHRNRAATTVLMCEQKPHPVWFSWRCKTYPVKCEHNIRNSFFSYKGEKEYDILKRGMGKYASNTEHMRDGVAAVIHTCTEGSLVTVLGDLINYFLRVNPWCNGHLIGSIGSNRFQ